MPDVTSIQRRQVLVNGQFIRFWVAGKGEPVILVHGLSGSMRWWRYTVPALAEHYRVYLLDLPGFGAMSHLRKTFVLRESAEWLFQWMQASGIARAHLVGHSMGAYVCLSMAARHAEATDCLVLVDPAGVPTSRSLPAHLLPLIQDVVRLPPALMPLLVYDALRAGPWTLWRVARDLVQEDVRAAAKRIMTPTLLIRGEKDTIVPAIAGHILHREITHSRLLVIKGARHVPMFEKPGTFNAALLAFLGGQPVGERGPSNESTNL